MNAQFFAELDRDTRSVPAYQLADSHETDILDANEILRADEILMAEELEEINFDLDRQEEIRQLDELEIMYNHDDGLELLQSQDWDSYLDRVTGLVKVAR